jgi:hypothetical protein
MAGDDVNAAYWAEFNRRPLKRPSPGLQAERQRHFAAQIRARRFRLALILADESQEWPPPAELTPWADKLREFPNRDQARKILELRSKNGKRGIRHIADEMWIGWRSVQWVVDVFES